MTEAEKFIMEINNGFKSIREEMSRGFMQAAKDTAKIQSDLATVIERVNTVREDQKELEGKVKEMNNIEKDVERNTQFRKNIVKAFWIALGVIITALTLASLSGLSEYISSQ